MNSKKVMKRGAPVERWTWWEAGAAEVREHLTRVVMSELNEQTLHLNSKLPTCTIGKVVKSSETATGFSISYNKQ